MGQPTVLVVDDERYFREAIHDVLRPSGVPCTFAATGQQALEQASDPDVGVVVLDLVLPDLHGLEVFRRLQERRPELRVIILSAHTDQANVLEALRLGAFDYLAKPLHEEELSLAVGRARATYEMQSDWTALRARLNQLEQMLQSLFRRAATVPSEALPAALVEAVRGVLGVQRASLMLLDPASGALRVVAAVGTKLEPEQMDPVAMGEGAAGLVAARHEALLVADSARDARFADRVPADRYRSTSFAIAPLISSGRAFGVICATERVPGAPLGADDLSLLRILGVQAARLLDRTPADADTTQELPAADPEADAELLREICEAVTEEVDPARLLIAALRPVAKRLSAAPVSLYLAGGEGLRREAELDGGVSSDRLLLERGRGLVGIALDTGRLVACDDPEADPRFDPEVDTAADGVVRALVCGPLRFKGRTLGVFRAFPEHAADARPETAQLLSAALSSALRTAQLARSLVASYEDLARARRAARAP